MRLTLKKRTAAKTQTRMKTKVRIRKKIFGTTERPRLNVFRSAKHIYAQLIDDESGKTLMEASSVSMKAKGCNRDGAKAVGAEIAKKAKTQNISGVVFDRNGFLYHGRIKELADAAREAGLNF